MSRVGVASFKSMRRILSSKLKPTEKVVCLSLAMYQGGDPDCFPTQQELADSCRLPLRTTNRAVAKLKSAGAITTTGSGKAIRYSVSTPDANDATDGVVPTTVAAPSTPNPVSNYAKSGAPNIDKGQKGQGDDVAFPEVLQTDDFRQAWSEWREHLRERKRPLTPLSAQKQLKMLAKRGAANAVAMIDQSIERGWLGLFDVDSAHNGIGKSCPKRKSADEWMAEDEAKGVRG